MQRSGKSLAFWIAACGVLGALGLIACAALGVAVYLLYLNEPEVPAWIDNVNRTAQFDVSVWPEYDDPRVLVIYDAILADKSNLPRQVSVLIPSGAQLLVTTWETPDFRLAVEQPSQLEDMGNGYKRVTFVTQQPKYHVEYYDDLLSGSPDRAMAFAFMPIAPADQLTFAFQEPLRTSNFAVSPVPQLTRSDPEGFNYHILIFSDMPAGQPITARVTYRKTDTNPSVVK